jgi:hypothetical protein
MVVYAKSKGRARCAKMKHPEGSNAQDSNYLVLFFFSNVPTAEVHKMKKEARGISHWKTRKWNGIETSKRQRHLRLVASHIALHLFATLCVAVFCRPFRFCSSTRG